MAALVSIAASAARPQETFPSSTQLQEIREYINRTWSALTRSTRDLPKAAPDPKIRRAPGEPSPVYLAADEDRTGTEQRLRDVLSADDFRKIELRTLDRKSTRLNSSHVSISYAVFCLKKKKKKQSSY